MELISIYTIDSFRRVVTESVLPWVMQRCSKSKGDPLGEDAKSDDDNPNNFIQRQDAWGRKVRQAREHAAGEKEYAAVIDKKMCPSCGAIQKYDEIVKKACPGSVELKLAPLKGSDRAGAKARDEYAKNTAPCYSWLFDVVRGSALCETEATS